MITRLIIIAVFGIHFASTAWSRGGSHQETDDLFASNRIETKPSIKTGFDLLYSLKFEEGRKHFIDWQTLHPSDPISNIAIAASYLFEEFYHQQVLTSEFFLDDRRFFGGIEGEPDKDRIRGFKEAYQRGRDLILRQLEANPDDADALFAMTLATGLNAYDKAFLEKDPRRSLSLMKESKRYAERLLELQPDRSDAFLAVGAVNYTLGVLPTLKRLFLWFTGTSGNKSLGMKQLRIAAEKGSYLRPFAKILLALAALREKQEDIARKQLSDLVAEYPDNHVFAEELARLTGRGGPAEKSGGSGEISD
jgi:hypothetical protein